MKGTEAQIKYAKNAKQKCIISIDGELIYCRRGLERAHRRNSGKMIAKFTTQIADYQKDRDFFESCDDAASIIQHFENHYRG